MKKKKEYLAGVLSAVAFLAAACGVIIWALLVWQGGANYTQMHESLMYGGKSFWQFWMDCWLILVSPFALSAVSNSFAHAVTRETGLTKALLSALGITALSIILALPAWCFYLAMASLGYLFVYLPLSLIGAGDWMGAVILLFAAVGLFGSDAGRQVVGAISFWRND